MRNSIYILFSLLVTVGSCTTQKRCADKFPPREISSTSDTLYIDKLIYISPEVTIPAATANLTLEKEHIKDTILQTDRMKIKVQSSANNKFLNIDCEAKEFQYKFDSLEVIVQDMVVNNEVLQQLYFDQKAENKRIKDSLKHEVKFTKANKRPATQEAKAKKWMWIGIAAVSLVLLLLLIPYTLKNNIP